ncbi:flagellar biosynthesis protein FlhB [Thermosulfuriphilus sp.]
MPEDTLQERTEEATPRRRQEAREKGQVAKSRELSSVAVLLAGLGLLIFMGGYLRGQMERGMIHFLGLPYSREPFDLATLGLLSDEAGRILFVCLAPVFLILSLVAFLANFLQIGAIFSADPLIPKPDRLNPIEGLKRLVSRQAMVELVKSLAKVAFVAAVAWRTIKGDFTKLIPLMDMSPIEIGQEIFDMSGELLFKILLAIALVAIFDFFYQRFEFERNLRMTRQEVKEEFKQTEGDPHVKARIRSIQREMARKRMMAEVPQADVVITNPTELAVALKYVPGEMEAPKVVAKGAGHLARRIREIAREHGVPVIENRPLAQGLFRQVEVGDFIPQELYQAVAEILAYVYRLKGKRLGG